jgi:hypothetical protein
MRDHRVRGSMRAKEVVAMTATPHEPTHAVREPREWTVRVLVKEMWASLAISVMWLAVLFDALWGPDFVASSAGSTTTIPSAIIVALFAYLGTRVVAKYGFDRSD